MVSKPQAGRVALITGAGSGIGRATAYALDALGFSCVLIGRRYQELRETAWNCFDARAIPADISNPSEAERVVDDAYVWKKRLDVIINNAGWSAPATIEETTSRLVRDVFDINAIAPTVIIARAWPYLMETKQRPAVIVNIGSLATRDPYPQLFAYAAAKASVNLLALSVAKAGREHGIQGYCVAPGAVETRLLRTIANDKQVPPREAMEPQAVAAVVAGCVNGEYEERNGETIYVTQQSPMG